MESRITELEIRLALQDDLLETLNQTVALQQQQIMRLQQEVRSLSDYLQGLDSISKTPLAHEIPPHY